jgi:hypothetical protein
VDLKLFEGYARSDIEFMGGESTMNETVGLGAFAQAAAFPLQDYQGGSPERVVEANLRRYDIAVGEHPEYQIPYLRFRGVPIGIDVHRVTQRAVTPMLDIGVAGKKGGQIGAGSFSAPTECFSYAADTHSHRYSEG